MQTLSLDGYDALNQVRCELALLRTLATDSRPLVMDKYDMIGLHQVLDRLVGKLDAVLKTLDCQMLGDDDTEGASHA